MMEPASAITEYNRLLDNAREATGALLAAIMSGDHDRLVDALDTRGRLLQELGESTELLSKLSADPSVRADRSLLSLFESAKEGQQSLLGAQRECENALTTELNQREREIDGLKRRKGLRRAYAGPTQKQDARFIDSRQ